jgi:hypothetical protein
VHVGRVCVAVARMFGRAFGSIVKVQVKAQRERWCGRVPWRVCYDPVLAKSSVWGSEGMRRCVRQGAQ